LIKFDIILDDQDFNRFNFNKWYNGYRKLRLPILFKVIIIDNLSSLYLRFQNATSSVKEYLTLEEKAMCKFCTLQIKQTGKTT